MQPLDDIKSASSAEPSVEPAGFSPELDARAHDRRVGLVVLATDHTSEADFRRMVASERIGVHVARIAYANPVTPENLARMQPDLRRTAALILPDEGLDALCYSCTSASVVIGDAAVAAELGAAKPGAAIVTPPLAATDALRALGARRISILTPYTVATSRPMAGYFEARDFDIASFQCLGMEDDREMARVSHGSIVEAATVSMAPDAEALFISCTALRAAAVVPAIEDRIGRPVVTSNLATAWACLRHCGDAVPRPEWGRLMAMDGGRQ